MELAAQIPHTQLKPVSPHSSWNVGRLFLAPALKVSPPLSKGTPLKNPDSFFDLFLSSIPTLKSCQFFPVSRKWPPFATPAFTLCRCLPPQTWHCQCTRCPCSVCLGYCSRLLADLDDSTPWMSQSVPHNTNGLLSLNCCFVTRFCSEPFVVSSCLNSSVGLSHPSTVSPCPSHESRTFKRWRR